MSDWRAYLRSLRDQHKVKGPVQAVFDGGIVQVGDRVEPCSMGELIAVGIPEGDRCLSTFVVVELHPNGMVVLEDDSDGERFPVVWRPQAWRRMA